MLLDIAVCRLCDIIFPLSIKSVSHMRDEKSRTIVVLMNVNNDISGRTVVGLTQ
jgi:hypothetical protein